jgi:cAMP-specific phosphodiesterase 4
MYPSRASGFPALHHVPVSLGSKSLLACAKEFSNHSKEAIVITSAPDGKIVHCNIPWVRMCGYTREDALGSTNRLLQGARTDMAVASALADALAHGAPEARAVLLNYKKGGEGFWNDLVVLAVPGFFVGFQKETPAAPVGPRDASRAAELLGCRRLLARAFSDKALLPWALPPVAHASATGNTADAYPVSDPCFVTRDPATGAPLHSAGAYGGGRPNDDCRANRSSSHHASRGGAALIRENLGSALSLPIQNTTGAVLGSKTPGGSASRGGRGAARARDLAGNALSLLAMIKKGVSGRGGRIYHASPSPIVVEEPPAAFAKAGGGALAAALAAAADSWTLDALRLSELAGGSPLCALGAHLFGASGLVVRLGLDATKLGAFLAAIEAGYDDSHAYHNKAHAAGVLHATAALLGRGGVAAAVARGGAFLGGAAPASAAAGGTAPATPCSEEDFVTLACLLAAAVHDYEHLGLSNGFLVKSSHARAARCGGAHANEAHHAAAALAVLARPECDFAAAALGAARSEALRALVAALILGTDAADDARIVGALGAALDRDGVPHRRCDEAAGTAAASAWAPRCEADAVLALQVALKAADVGHLALPWPLHRAWVARLEVEFFAQGDAERGLGLAPLSALCDRAKPGAGAGQAGFFAHVAAPLFGALSRAFPAALPLAARVGANRVAWAAIDEGGAPRGNGLLAPLSAPRGLVQVVA